MGSPQTIQQMKEKARAVQAEVCDIRSLAEAYDYAVRLTREQGGTTIAVAGFDIEETTPLESRCADAGLELLSGALRPHAGEIHTAVTPAHWGIAETGSLVVDSRSEDLRIATMLADTHVAVLPVSRVEKNMASLEKILQDRLKEDTPSYTAFITGASRTADIERVLAIGVHGPKELHILLMEDNAQ